MPSPLTADDQALHLFFTEDLYLVGGQHEQPNSAVQAGVIQGVQPAAEVRTEKTSEETILAGVPVYKSLGNNKRHILILVNDAENEVSSEAGRELLRKIVKSVNLTANDFALLNYASHPGTSLEQLMPHFHSVLVFAFGVSAAQLGLNKQPENTIISHEGLRLIFSSELKQLDTDANGKKSLWGCLKQLGL